MQIAVPVLLVIILAIVIVMVVLIIFQGETNRKVEKLNKQLIKLNKRIYREQRNKEKRITNINNQSSRLYRHSLNSEHKNLQSEEQQQAIREKIIKPITFPDKVKKITRKVKDTGYLNEVFWGESIINKIGIAVLALGIALFVKYAIESSWINNAGRVGIGVLSGSVLIVIAHLLHKKYRAFSSVLLGGGLAVLYYTTAIAYDEYHIVSHLVAFIFTFLITAFSVSLSIAYNRPELAFFATLAALTAPLLVGFTTDGYVTLFTYLLVINIGILVLVYYKKWLILNLLSFYGTFAFIVAWFLMLYFKEKPIPHLEAFVFLSVYYVIFIVMHIINNVKHERVFLPIQLTLVIFSNIMYYSGSIVIIRDAMPNYDGLFTAFMGVLNFIVFFILFKRQNIDKNLLNLLLGLVIVFVALVPPVQMVGKNITLVWSIQMVLLLWLSRKIDFNIMRLSSVGMLLMMLISLGMDLWSIYVSASSLSSPLPLFFNKGFVVSFVSSISLGAYAYILGTHQGKRFVFIPKQFLQSFTTLLMVVTFYLTFLLEIRYQVNQHVQFKNSIDVFLGIYNFGFLALGSVPALFLRKRKLNMLSWVIGFVAFIVYFSFYHSIFIHVRDSYILKTGATYGAYVSHFIIIGILLLINFISLRSAVVCERVNSKMAYFSLWSTVFMLLFIFSSELDSIYIVNNYKSGFVLSDYVLKAHTLPYTILWGGFSFVLIFLGMLLHFKELRNISLLIFFITIGKMFIFDLSRISRSSQIIEFLFMGVVLLAASFMYHKSKYNERLATGNESE